MGSLWTAGWEKWKSSQDLWQSCPWAQWRVGAISVWPAVVWVPCWAGRPRCPWAVSSSAFPFFASCQFFRPQLAGIVCSSLTFRKRLDQNVLGCFFSSASMYNMMDYTLLAFLLITSSETCQVMQPCNRFPRKLVDPHPWRLLKPQLDQTIPDALSVGVSLILSWRTSRVSFSKHKCHSMK